jgi:predicted AAA+ superfamily ATPase
VNGAIDVSLKYPYYVAEPIGEEAYLNKVLNGEIVVVAGPRASGKTTRMFQLVLELQKRGFLCLP